MNQQNIYATLSLEDEVAIKRKLISDARIKRIQELKRFERDRAKELLNRYRAVAEKTRRSEEEYNLKLTLHEERKSIARELKALEERLSMPDANTVAATLRKRAHEEHALRKEQDRYRNNSAIRRANEALQLLEQQKERSARERERKANVKLLVRDVEGLRAKQAALLARDREIERELAFRAEEHARRTNSDVLLGANYAFVDVTKDQHVPLMVNTSKMTDRANLSIIRAVPEETDNAFAAARSISEQAGKRLRERNHHKREAISSERIRVTKAVEEADDIRLADAALRLLQGLQDKVSKT